MERIMENVDTVVLILAIVLNAAMLIYSLVRSFVSDKGSALEKWVKLMEAARIYEAEAEGFAHYSAAEKLNYVLSRLRTDAAAIGVPFEEEKVTAAVEADIAFTKTVNCTEKTAECD
jgi:hypothetical protein